MSALAIGVLAGVLCGIIGWALAEGVWRGRRKRARLVSERNRRILFPFAGQSLSYAALDSAIRLARAEDATLVPVFLACVPLRLGLDAAMPRQAGIGVTQLEAIEQRALRAGVPVDSRVVRGRSAQHGLQLATEQERFYRMVLPAVSPSSDGLDAQTIAWALDHAPGEIAILRANPGAATK